MAFYNEAWFVHQVSDNVTHLAQQKRSKITGSHRVKEGVVGKSWPFNKLSSLEMEEVTARDSDTNYLNPAQSKVRCELRDFVAAVLVDSFDEVKELANAQSEFALMLSYSRNRRTDRLALSVQGLLVAGASGGAVGGYIGMVRNVDEGAESTSLVDLPAGQQIVNGGTNLTMAKILDAAKIMNDADVDQEDRYFFYSPAGMRKLLTDTQVTSSDYSSINALTLGTFPMDAMWAGFKWRMSTLLPKVGNIRSCIAVQKMAVGCAYSAIKELEIDKAVHKNNAMQVLAKLTGGTTRIDDVGVVQVDIDETA